MEDIKVTNLQRLISDPDVRKLLGISLLKGRLASNTKKDVVTKALTVVLTDMMNKDFKVSKIYKKEDRERYIHNLLDGSINPTSVTNDTATWDL